MNLTQPSLLKAGYQAPTADMLTLLNADILSTSRDPNQGEWDPQSSDDMVVW